jgi:hypothetical protein
MFQLTKVASSPRSVFLALLLIVFCGSALAQGPSGPPQPPWGPAVAANGTYTVNWLPQGTTTYLQERIGTTGTWVNVSSSLYQSSGSSYSVTYTGKPAGDYFYRLRVAFTNQYGTTWSHSNEIRVTVYGGPVPTQDLVSNQLLYTYETRIGDLNGDGRQDVYVNRTAGGVALNGTLGSVILQQNSDSSFTPFVPTAGQASTAAGWAASSTLLELEDFNFDGYVDIRLPNLGSVIPGVFGQIIFSSASVGNAAPKKVTAINAKVSKFLADTQLWIDQPHYFTTNASIVYVPVYVQEQYCDYVWQGDYYSYECWYEWVFVGYQAYYDFSPWDIDAVKMRYSLNPNTSGEVEPTVVPGSTDAGDIDRWFRNVFGVDLARGILTIGNCSGTQSFQYDSDTSFPCIRIGLPLIATVWTQPSSCRPLTFGEKELTAIERVHIFNVDAVRICHRAYMYSWVPSFLKSDVMAPDGNIYIRPGGWFTWREDYTYGLFATPAEYGTIQHELVHVFQTRNGGCGKYCMLAQRIMAPGSGAYVYWPLDPSKTFRQHNIEQQAQMVEDRFRTQPSIGLPPASGNPGDPVTRYQTLNGFIPTLQGFMKLH